MKIDNYTKFLLTVITMCLLYLCLRDLIAIPKVHADEPIHVVLVDSSDLPVAAGGLMAPGKPLRIVVEQR
jgi:hypothetical protein